LVTNLLEIFQNLSELFIRTVYQNLSPALDVEAGGLLESKENQNA